MKKILVFLLMLVMLMQSIVFADEISTKFYNVDAVLLNFGYPIDVINSTPENEKYNVAQVIIASPEKVHMTFSTVEINEIASIEKVVNSTNLELMNEGYSKKDIDNIREKIEYMRKMTIEELMNKYSRSYEEIKIWKRALQRNLNYKDNKKDGNIATTSGTISSSNLTYSQTVYDNNYSTTGLAVSYRAYSTFTWHDSYFWDCFNDQVVFGWGGNLATKDITHRVTYTNDEDYDWTVVETPVNAGLKFTTPQEKIGAVVNYQIKDGYTGVTLYQKQKQNYDTKVLSSYGHKMGAFGAGIGVSASGPSVSLTFSTGFDYSPQQSHSITY